MMFYLNQKQKSNVILKLVNSEFVKKHDCLPETNHPIKKTFIWYDIRCEALIFVERTQTQKNF